MTTETPSEKIVDRIRKLLALAGNNPNEHEAVIAMRRAQALLARYNLTMESLPEDERNKEEPYVRERTEYKQRFRPYGRTIADSIAELYFCKMFYRRQHNMDVYSIVGRKSNVAIAIMVIDNALQTLTSQAKASSSHAGYQTNFMDAASQRVYVRCRAMVKDAEEGNAKEVDSGEGTEFSFNLPALRATYLAERNNCDAFISGELKIEIKTEKSRASGGRGGFDGFGAGARAGDSVSLRPGLQNKKQAALT